MRAAILTLGLITAIQGSSALGSAVNRGEPVRIVNGYPIVNTFLNGQGPFRMMIDTGAVRCAVRPSVAVRVGLIPSGRVLLTTFVGGRIVPTARTSVRIGGREVSGTQVVINDLPSLDLLESRVDGLIGQNLLSLAPYLIDFKGSRLWLGDQAVQKAQRFSAPERVEFLSGRPVILVSIDSKTAPMHLILDSGVNDLVLRCSTRCGTLLDVRAATAVTNAGRIDIQKGRVPVTILGSDRFFRMQAVLMRNGADQNNAEGAVPLNWFSAVYVHPAQGVIRWSR